MALRGTLRDFGIADIFQLIGHQGKTGFLIVRERGREVKIGFRDGHVVSAHSTTRRERDMLGGLLVRAEVITHEQLGQALDIQKKSGDRLGDVLINSGLVEPPSLAMFVKLQLNETLYQLFLWTSGTYEFNQTEIGLPTDVEPIRSETVLMEGFRQVDEWPLIRKSIPGYAITFHKLEDLEKLDAGEKGQADAELDFDDAFAEFESGQSSERTGRLKDIGRKERTVYQLIVPGRDVQKIIDLSRLGEFETCKALAALISAGIIETETVADTRQQRAVQAAAPLGGGIAARRVGGVAPLMLKVAAVAAGLVVLFMVGQRTYGLRLRGWVSLRESTGYVAQDVQSVVSATQMQKIERALAVYRAEAGDYPKELAVLVDAGLLKSNDIRFPWKQPYFYATRDGRYELLRPLY
ncbi:MAG: DUF4388 domain-containing protein [Myxococcota bacterium]|nr:DUF4388 domain-containing protein [Myxococcota bacterium]